MKYRRHIPNVLTILRIILVPVYLVCLYMIEDKSTGALAALIVFISAAVTDYFDGVLARKLKSVTDFGKVVDPLADKIIVSVALITIALSPMRFISFYIVFIIIFREILVTILRNWYQKRKIYVAANFWGKMKTTFQMIGIISALAFNAGRYRIQFLQTNQDIIVLAIQIFFWYVAVVTVVSGTTYLPFMKKRSSMDRETE